MATLYPSTCGQADVAANIMLAETGDTVVMPAGEATWGGGGSYLLVNKAITLEGDPVNTIITLADTAGGYTNGTIRISAGGMVRNFRVNGSNVANATPFSTSTTNGWRITGITFAGGTSQGYFLYSPNYGLVDNCDITGNNGGAELIFTRGPTDSWQTPHSMGTANALYVEDCIFRGSGYVNDANSNSRVCIRNCLITGKMKIDAHGVASNTPPRGCRQLEAYRNHWTATADSWVMIEHRGGNARLWGNTTKNRSASGLIPVLRVTDYGYAGTTWGAWGGVVQTLLDYPILDQVGVGMDPKAAASEPNYFWLNRKGTDDENSRSEIVAQPTIGEPVAQSLTKYQNDMRVINDDPTGTYTFVGADMIKADRDYFTEAASFDGSTGVGVGTRATMDSITPTKTGVGFWVTDEGSWDTTLDPNTSGRLYVWNGSAWVLDYTPYAYPHPLRTGIDPDPPGPTPYAFPVRRSGFGFGIGGIL